MAHNDIRINGRTIKGYIKCTLFLIAGAFLFSCNTDTMLQQQYNIEKIFFRAEKTASTVLINYRIAPVADYKKAIRLYHKVIRTTDQLDDVSASLLSIVQQSLLRIANLEMLREEPDKAKAAYKEILKRFPNDEIAVKAQLALGSVEEGSFAYKEAIDSYSKLMPRLSNIIEPENPSGTLMNLPLRVAQISHLYNDPEAVKQALYKAERKYIQLMQKWPKSSAGLQAASYLATVYAQQEEWKKIENLIEKQLVIHTDSTIRPSILYSRGNLYHRRMNLPGRAMKDFRTLERNYPDHAATTKAKFSIAQIYLSQKKYKPARIILKDLIKNNGKNHEFCAQAQEAYAFSYAAENQWQTAINEFRWLHQNYETTRNGLLAPIHIINYFKNEGDESLAKKAVDDAVQFYRNLVTKYPKSMIAALSQEQLTNLFYSQKKWDEAAMAAQTIGKILDNRTGEISTLFMLANIYEASNQRKLEEKIHKQIFEKYPNHPMSIRLKERLSLAKK